LDWKWNSLLANVAIAYKKARTFRAVRGLQLIMRPSLVLGRNSCRF